MSSFSVELNSESEPSVVSHSIPVLKFAESIDVVTGTSEIWLAKTV